MSETVYDFTCADATGKPVDLGDYRGKVLLIVNTASKCGFTPQFAGLEALYEDLSAQDFAILGFPCNQFGGQDPGSNDEIVEFCQLNYGVSFPMMEKVNVKAGEDQSPIYGLLGTRTGELPDWNFAKYLISRDGSSVQFFGARTAPLGEELTGAIEALL